MNAAPEGKRWPHLHTDIASFLMSLERGVENDDINLLKEKKEINKPYAVNNRRWISVADLRETLPRVAC